jgi:hypothetical protein
MELGLLKLVHAAKLLPLEQALAGLNTGGNIAAPVVKKPEPIAPPRPTAAAPPRVGPSPFAMDAARKTSTPPPVSPAQFQPSAASPRASGPLKDRLHAWLVEQTLTFEADAVEHADVAETAAELVFTAPREFSMALRSKEMQKAVLAVLGKSKKLRVEVGEGSTEAVKIAVKQDEDAAKLRATEDPDVQRFQELFPGSQIRNVRNLKE